MRRRSRGSGPHDSQLGPEGQKGARMAKTGQRARIERLERLLLELVQAQLGHGPRMQNEKLEAIEKELQGK